MIVFSSRVCTSARVDSVKCKSKANAEVVCGLARRRDCEWSEDCLQRAVSGEDRIVVNLDDANVNSAASAHINPPAEFHRKARHTVVILEVECREGLNRLINRGAVVRRSRQNMREWFDARIHAIVLDLNAAEKVVEPLAGIHGGRGAAAGVYDLILLVAAGEIALHAKILCEIVSC